MTGFEDEASDESNEARGLRERVEVEWIENVECISMYFGVRARACRGIVT